MFTFLSSLGGAISLYLGISLVSVFELFEIILRMTVFRSATGRGKNPENNPSVSYASWGSTHKSGLVLAK